MVHRSRRPSSSFGGLEKLETRQLLSAATFVPQATSFVYTETDNSNAGQNAVIAYRNHNGQLTKIGSFKTGGTGVANPAGLLGPDDSDKEVIASPDGRFLFAVNQGSNTVAVFRVRGDGSLRLVNDTADSSGGTQPVSLSIGNGRLYVVNRGDEVQGQTGSIAPTITVFKIGQNGILRQDFAATTTLPLGLSPSQLLISADSKLAFVDTFTPPPLNNVTGANQVLPFRIANDGKLIPVSTGGLGVAVNPPLLLGLAQNPTTNIIYAGLTGAAQIGVFTFDKSGDLTLAGTVSVSGKGPCWTTVSADGKFLYTVDTGTNSVGVFSLADPLHPKQIQEFDLGGPQNPANDPNAPSETTDFEFALDPSGKELYVINHQTDAAGDFPHGNALHVLSVATDGTLSESSQSPLFLPSDIPAGADPQGVAVIAASKIEFAGFSDRPLDDPGFPALE
jgi:6-phosphogluconolactonase (cycloisomerase 2 family)